MNTEELYSALSDRIPAALSCQWDNDGLMCLSDPEREIKKVLLTLDITPEAVGMAVSGGFDLIVSHHPIIFRPLKSLGDRRLVTLVKNGISAFSFHTRLDAVKGGVNDALCAVLGLTDIGTFGEGLGRTGDAGGDIPCREFAAMVKERLGAPYIDAVLPNRYCRKIAVLGGDGKDEYEAALESGCDTYLTGSMSYNAMTDAAHGKINVIAAGHYFTEQPVLSALEGMIKEAAPDIVCGIFACNSVLCL